MMNIFYKTKKKVSVLFIYYYCYYDHLTLQIILMRKTTDFAIVRNGIFVTVNVSAWVSL